MKKTKLIDMDRASLLLKLLGDPTRLTMMKLLKSNECCVCEFVEIFKMSQPAISQHLSKLKSILEHLPQQAESINKLKAQGLRITCE